MKWNITWLRIDNPSYRSVLMPIMLNIQRLSLVVVKGATARQRSEVKGRQQGRGYEQAGAAIVAPRSVGRRNE